MVILQIKFYSAQQRPPVKTTPRPSLPLTLTLTTVAYLPTLQVTGIGLWNNLTDAFCMAAILCNVGLVVFTTNDFNGDGTDGQPRFSLQDKVYKL